jgi:hypothetical protein
MTGRVAMKAPTQVAGAMPRLMARRAILELKVRYIVLDMARPGLIESIIDLEGKE